MPAQNSTDASSGWTQELNAPSDSMNTAVLDASVDQLALEPVDVSDGFAPRPTGRGPTGCPPSQTNSSTAQTLSTPIASTPQPRSKGDDGPSSFGLLHAGASSTAQTATHSASENGHGPQHPYSLYPQNIGPDDNPSPIVSIPIGLPGMGQTYTRQEGSRREDIGDIVTPDGYTEQLPPYTRYANQVPPPQPIPSRPVQAHLGDATNGPNNVGVLPDPGRSEESLNPLPSHPSTHSVVSASSRDRLRNGGPSNSGVAMKEKLAETANRRVCGGSMPRWACVAIVIIAILFSCLIGGIYGGVKARQKINVLEKAQQGATPAATVYATKTMIFDASPLPSLPAGLPSLPFGTFLLPLGDAKTATSGCVQNDGMDRAWSCDLSINSGSQMYMQMQVTQAQGSIPDIIQLSIPDWQSTPLRYGAQPPLFRDPQNLSLAMDQGNSWAGPAYTFQVVFDKLVILEESVLSESSPQAGTIDGKAQLDARDLDDHHQLFKRDIELKPGDKPWFCYWNSTILEGFIFLTKDTASVQSSNKQGSTTAANPPSQGATTPSLTVTVPSSGSSNTAPAADATVQATIEPRSQTYINYPKAVKLAEHRGIFTEDRILPLCQQMQVLDNMKTSPITKLSTGEPVIIHLDESHGDSTPSRLKRREWSFAAEGAGLVEKRDEAPDPSRCECRWMLE